MNYSMIKNPDRQVLTPQYIRKLIDTHYTFTCNYFQFTSLYSITLFLKTNYSNKITQEMVLESLDIEPSYKIYSMCGKSGCRYVMKQN